MEFLYSEMVSSDAYITEGLGYGISLRIHKNQDKEVEGTLRAQRDWTESVAPIEGYHGNLADPYSFVSVTVPECLPDRLQVISYANEFAFLYDDKLEKLDLKPETRGTDEFLETFGAGVLDSKLDAKTGPEKRLQAQVLSEMMAIDPKRAVTSMKAWARFVQSASQIKSMPFETLEQYIPMRVVDAGELIWFGTLTFGMALTIPENETELCMELARPAYVALGLVNDLYSWEKEREESLRMGQDYVFNAVWVIMKERSIGEDEAKEICREEILKAISTYCRVVEQAKHDSTLSKDLRAYLEAVLLSYIGNLVWSIYCPRYHQI